MRFRLARQDPVKTRLQAATVTRAEIAIVAEEDAEVIPATNVGPDEARAVRVIARIVQALAENPLFPRSGEEDRKDLPLVSRNRRNVPAIVRRNARGAGVMNVAVPDTGEARRACAEEMKNAPVAPVVIGIPVAEIAMIAVVDAADGEKVADFEAETAEVRAVAAAAMVIAEIAAVSVTGDMTADIAVKKRRTSHPIAISN